VIAAGVAAGYWTALPQEKESEGFDWYCGRNVLTPSGNTFQISARDGKISACVATLHDEKPHGTGVKVSATEVGDQLCASADATRDPARVAQDLFRRVVSNPKAQALADKVRAKLTERLAQRARLLQYVDILKPLGFSFSVNYPLSDSETATASLWHRDMGRVRLNAAGEIYVDHITIEIANVGAIIPLLKK
jgi:hypothetical protein